MFCQKKKKIYLIDNDSPVYIKVEIHNHLTVGIHNDGLVLLYLKIIHQTPSKIHHFKKNIEEAEKQFYSDGLKARIFCIR